MRVLVTGMIAGMDDADYLRRVVALGQRNNREIKVYNSIDDFTKAGKNLSNVFWVLPTMFLN